ncbi:hypothetical protein K438DRAFT_1981267 [Mycena galopus ATCC 62051]|nr:hypothetical protein K438DRAFT_1981267 [Mycena galopus ATCC 62051]
MAHKGMEQSHPSAEMPAPQARPATPSIAEILAMVAEHAAQRAVKSIPRSSSSSKISLAKVPPMFDGEDKSKWETWYDALTDYIGAYESDFGTDKRKIYFTISLLGKSDGSPCQATIWKRNWKKRTLREGYLSDFYTFEELKDELELSFKDQNGCKGNLSSACEHGN